MTFSRYICPNDGIKNIENAPSITTPETHFSQKAPRPSKLDPYQDLIDQFLEQDPQVYATVLLQRLQDAGFDGKISILRDYLHEKRGQSKNRKAFVRFESAPGHQCQIDWGHFGSIAYGNTKRRLYCMAVIESHSRLLYLEFTHSQRQETLHRCLLNAFRFFGGTPRELVSDNMLTAVIERDGSLIRYNESFLEFLRPFAIVPYACNVRSPHEKGKVEKGALNCQHTVRPHESNNVDSGNHNMSVPSSAWVKRLKSISNALPLPISPSKTA